MAATAMVGGKDNNQLKAAKEDMVAVEIVTEIATTTKTAMVTAMTKTPMPTMVH
jgi:hypothetical protein